MNQALSLKCIAYYTYVHGGVCFFVTVVVGMCVHVRCTSVCILFAVPSLMRPFTVCVFVLYAKAKSRQMCIQALRIIAHIADTHVILFKNWQ